MVIEYFNWKEPQLKNPEETVAFGAAFWGGIICGDTLEETESLVNIYATPFTLVIETVGGVMIKIIPKASSIPKKKS